MRTLFFILNRFSTGVGIICVLVVGVYIWECIKQKSFFKDHAHIAYRIAISIAIVGLVITTAPFQNLVQIDNLEFKPDGEYCYYVILENDSGMDAKKLPARIKISTKVEDDEGVYGEPKQNTSYHYILKEVFYDNYTEIFTGELNINESELVEGEHNNYMICTLLNEKAYLSKYSFDNGITAPSIIYFAVLLISMIAAFFILNPNSNKE